MISKRVLFRHEFLDAGCGCGFNARICQAISYAPFAFTGVPMEFSVGMVVNTIHAIPIAEDLRKHHFTMSASAWSVVTPLLFCALLLPLKVFRSTGGEGLFSSLLKNSFGLSFRVTM